MPKQMDFADYLDWLSANQNFLTPKKAPARHTAHPGRVLWEEYLLPKKISQSQFAKQIGCTHAKVNELINGKRNLSAEFALDIEWTIGISADYLISLQAAWDLERARRTRRSKK